MGAREEFDGFVEVAPSRGRGLKLEIFAGDKFYQQVAPSRGRGLKLMIPLTVVVLMVSPLHGGVD